MKDGQENKKPLGMEEDRTEKSGGTGVGLGLCFGSAIGLLVFAVTGNITWFPIGVAIGYSLGFTFGTTSKKGR